jgi:hypothetical protein
MSFKHVQVLAALASVALVLSGCDFGRGGIYKIAFTISTTPGTTALLQQTGDEKVKDILRHALASKGFNEYPGTPYLWQKRGVWVEVYRDQNGELILKVRAFGSKNDVRVSEQIEQELLRLLKQQPGVELTPMTPLTSPVKGNGSAMQPRSNATAIGEE